MFPLPVFRRVQPSNRPFSTPGWGSPNGGESVKDEGGRPAPVRGADHMNNQEGDHE